jgi:hypothetical protein
MGVFDFEENRLRQQEIELKALIALAEFGNDQQIWRARRNLEYIAYPEELASDINQEKITNYKKRIRRDYFGNCMVCGVPSNNCECKE